MTDQATSAPAGAVPILDTHQHLIYPDQAGYGWTHDIASLTKRSFTLEDYQRLTAGLGIGGTLFMEAAVDDAQYQAENDFIVPVAALPASGVLGLITTCRPEDGSGFDQWLERCASQPVVGYRRILHVVADTLSESATFRSNVRKIGQRDKVFDMCFLQRQLGIAYQFAAACDNTQLVLDHCGMPDIDGGDIAAWRTGIAALAAMPHVYCKLSGVLAYCGTKPATLETIRPYVDYVLEKFGPQRMVWGSDWPVVNITSSIGDWIGITRQILAGLSDAEAAALAHGTAQKVYQVAIP